MTVEPKTTVAVPPEPQLPMLRFGLRQLFWFVTAVCLLIAAVVAAWDAGMTALALLLAILVVVLHVVGTAIGFRLRAHADERRAWEALQGNDASQRTTPGVLTVGLARSPLHGNGLPLHWLPLWVAAGAIAGGSLGMAILVATIGHRTSVAGVAVGAVSTAVVGAWFAFLGASFWAILRQGWRDAVSEHRCDNNGPADNAEPPLAV